MVRLVWCTALLLLAAAARAEIDNVRLFVGQNLTRVCLQSPRRITPYRVERSERAPLELLYLYSSGGREVLEGFAALGAVAAMYGGAVRTLYCDLGEPLFLRNVLDMYDVPSLDTIVVAALPMFALFVDGELYVESFGAVNAATLVEALLETPGSGALRSAVAGAAYSSTTGKQLLLLDELDVAQQLEDDLLRQMRSCPCDATEHESSTVVRAAKLYQARTARAWQQKRAAGLFCCALVGAACAWKLAFAFLHHRTRQQVLLLQSLRGRCCACPSHVELVDRLLCAARSVDPWARRHLACWPVGRGELERAWVLLRDALAALEALDQDAQQHAHTDLRRARPVERLAAFEQRATLGVLGLAADALCTTQLPAKCLTELLCALRLAAERAQWQPLVAALSSASSSASEEEQQEAARRGACEQSELRMRCMKALLVGVTVENTVEHCVRYELRDGAVCSLAVQRLQPPLSEQQRVPDGTVLTEAGVHRALLAALAQNKQWSRANMQRRAGLWRVVKRVLFPPGAMSFALDPPVSLESVLQAQEQQDQEQEQAQQREQEAQDPVAVAVRVLDEAGVREDVLPRDESVLDRLAEHNHARLVSALLGAAAM